MSTVNPDTFSVMPDEYVQQYGINAIKKYCTNDADEQEAYRYWLDQLVQLALTRFKWVGLPPSIPARAVEYTLLQFGCGAFFEESGGHLFAQACGVDMYNMYWDLREVLITGANGSQWHRWAVPHAVTNEATGEQTVLDPDCVVMWDNMARTPLLPKIKYAARRLARCEVITDVNIEAQATPWIIAAPPEGKRNAGRWQKLLEKANKFIKLNDQTPADTLPYVLNTNAPFTADKIQVIKHTILNDVLTLLGIDNTNVDKKERVQTAEVLSNNDLISVNRDVYLRCRNEAGIEIARMFAPGMDIHAEWDIEGVMAMMAQIMNNAGLTTQGRNDVTNNNENGGGDDE